LPNPTRHWFEGKTGSLRAHANENLFEIIAARREGSCCKYAGCRAGSVNMALPPHLVRFAEHLPATGSVVVNGDTVRFGDGTLACPATVPARGVASVLHDLGIGAAAIVEMSAGLAAPCRLIRFDTHGTVFVIEEPVPE